MTRMEYWCRARTQYALHSPFLFELYRSVLFARLDRATRKRLPALLGGFGVDLDNGLNGIGKQALRSGYVEIVYKLCDHYRLRVLCFDADEAVLEGDAQAFGKVKVVCRPHSCPARELRWQAQQGNSKYNVSLDLYDVGLLLSMPRLSPQHLLLK